MQMVLLVSELVRTSNRVSVEWNYLIYHKFGKVSTVQGRVRVYALLIISYWYVPQHKLVDECIN